MTTINLNKSRRKQHSPFAANLVRWTITLVIIGGLLAAYCWWTKLG